MVIDGTKPGASRCSSKPADQDLRTADGRRKARRAQRDRRLEGDGVSIDNLTVCNFLGDGGGNQIWWNGGDGTGTIGMHA